MSEIKREPDENNVPHDQYQFKIEELASTVLDDRKEVLFFLGAGAAVSPDGQTGLPSGRKLATELANDCHLDWSEEVPLSTVAFFHESLRGRERLNQFLEQRIAPKNSVIQPSPTIVGLVNLVRLLEARGMQTLVVTTNYDRKFEEEYEKQLGTAPEIVIFRGATDPNIRDANLHFGLGRYQEFPQLWAPGKTGKKTCLFKMHGCISQAMLEERCNPQSDDRIRTMVVTEEDYINFLTNSLSSQDVRKQIPQFVSARIAMSKVLFIGYSLSDWNFRVIYKATAEAKHTHTDYAVQYFQPGTDPRRRGNAALQWDNSVKFWSRKNVEILNVEAAVFMQDLLDEVKKQAAGLVKA